MPAMNCHDCRFVWSTVPSTKSGRPFEWVEGRVPGFAARCRADDAEEAEEWSQAQDLDEDLMPPIDTEPCPAWAPK